MLVRYLLEKCKTTEEVIESLNRIPIASQQTLTVMDHAGNFAVIECNCSHVEIIKPTGRDCFVVAANGFVSPKMTEYNNHAIDDWIFYRVNMALCASMTEVWEQTQYGQSFTMLKTRRFSGLREIHHVKSLWKIPE